MDYEAIDRDMSSWVVSTVHYGTRFYIADNDSDTATDMLSRAKLFRWQDQAEAAAFAAHTDFPGWNWKAITVPEAMNARQAAQAEGSR